jgi:cobalt/nickel transport system permease protein
VTRFASVLAKSWISVQAAILLVRLTTLPELLWGLQALRTPTILVTIAGFTYRYLDVLRNEASRLRTARKARSGTIAGLPGGGSLQWRARVTGWMVGSLMTRSIERSERIYNAMLARGYRGEIRTLTQFKINSTDRLTLAIAALVYLMTISIAYIS